MGQAELVLFKKGPHRNTAADFYKVMERDHRLTGKFRGQSDAVEAPVGFERMWSHLQRYVHRTQANIPAVNSRWKVCDNSERGSSTQASDPLFQAEPRIT